MFFASDNTSGVPEQILTALSRANDGFAMGYGGDALMEQVRDKLRAVFEAAGFAIVARQKPNRPLMRLTL